MSPSDESAKLSAVVIELRGQIERTIQAEEVQNICHESITNLMSGAVKLYAAMVEEEESGTEAVPVIDGTVSTTEAMVVACALLRAQRLNPFDLAVWFSRTATGRGRPGSGT